MIAAWVKALLFVGGGVTAAAGTAYVTGMLDPWFATPPQTIAALPQDPEAKPAPQEQTPPAVTVPQPEDPQTAPKQARLQPPTFDLLRVEPDGSVVIAGKAMPDASIEVLNADAVIANTTSTPDGDFVAVLDVPLAPGDYQLSLRATSGGDVSMSEATAIVSIPETPNGEVLAMVEEPGKPAEIITAPAAAAVPAEEQPAEAAPEEEIAAAPAEEPAGQNPPAEADLAADTPEAPAELAAEEEQPAEQEIAATPVEEPAVTPAGEAAPEEQVVGEETVPVEAEIAAAPADEPAPVEDEPAPAESAAGEDAPAEQAIAALPADEQAPAAPEQPAVQVGVVVEAVEIEGDTVFVAGSATPGRTVRVYANALYLGDSKASEGGRFLIEAKRDLPVGDYVIRADLLEADGTVVARAAVPFEREPGEAIAAVAPPAASMPAESDAATVEEEVAAAAPTPQTAEPGAPAEEEVAAAPSAPADADAGIAPAEMDVAEVPAQPDEQGAVPSTPPAQEEAAAASQPAAPSDDKPADVAEQPAGEPEVEVAAAPPAEDDAGLTAPKLQRVDGAVIIRRGDNLWRISRRVYGMGVRFSTIYLANQDQITDPDRIWPGQVFSVPQETAEGEAADLEAMGEQSVSPDTESKIIR